MKKIKNLLTILVTLLFAMDGLAQQVGIHPSAGTSSHSSAILDISASDKGILIPRMDSTARKNIAGPAKGLMVFDSTYNSFWYYDGTAWTILNGPDQQDLQLSNDTLSLTNDASTISLADFKQSISIVNDTLRLSNAPTKIDLAAFRDDLGNHIATQNIQLKDYNLSRDGIDSLGLFIDSLGQVSLRAGGLKRTGGDLMVGVQLETEAIAESQSVHNIEGAYSIPQSQSFTIPYDGLLTKFTIYANTCFFDNSPDFYIPFELYKAGVGLVASGTSTVSCINNYVESIIDRIPVYKGEVYSIKIYLQNNMGYRPYLNTTNPYAGGNCSLDPNWDFAFAYHMEKDPGSYNFTDTALIIMDNYRFPVTDGNPNDILITDGNGQVNWAIAGIATGDHLGNHTMNQDLQLNGNWINNDGGTMEGLYIDSIGRVGINTIPASNLHVPMGAMPNPGFRVTDTSIVINEYSLPIVDGMANQVLATDGTGQTNWVSPPPPKSNQQLSLSSDMLSLTNGGPPIDLAPYLDADNLGNHTASQNIYLDTFWIQNDINDTTGLYLNHLNSLKLIANTARPAGFQTTTPLIGSYIEVLNNSNGIARFGAGGSDFIPGGDTLTTAIGNFNSTGSLNMWVGSQKRMSISANGNVGIGRTASTNILEVEGTASKAAAGNWLANSDARLKKNIRALDTHEMLDKLLSLQGIRYQWADDQTGMQRPEGIQYGFTAQNIQAVFPTLVSEDQQGYLQTAYGTYDAMTVEAIRALNRKLEKLDSQTSVLEQEQEVMTELRSQMQAFQTKK